MKKISAELAKSSGLITEILPQDQLMTRALALATELAQQSGTAMQSILRTIDQGLDINLNDALDMEALYFGICCATADKDEGVTAFLEKRKPVFSGA